MSSPAGLQSSHSQFLSRWIPSSSRAGVFLNASSGELTSVQSSCSSLAQEAPLDDSFCSQFAPLPVSRSSSLDSVVPRTSGTDPETPVSSSEVDSVSDLLRQAQGLPLIARLEQLKQLQQRMQEQLRAHQLEQLQKLQNEPQSFQVMAQTPTEYRQQIQTCHKSEESQPIPTASTLLPSVPRVQQTHQEEMESTDSAVWYREQSSFSHDGEEDYNQNDTSQQSVTEDQSIYRKDMDTETQDRPIRSGIRGKTFEEMLEEQLKLENEKLTKNVTTEAAKVKRPFLKRGEGLSRFTRGKATALSRDRKTPSSSKPTSCIEPPSSHGPVIKFHQNSEPKRLSQKSSNSTNVVIQRKTAVLNKENLYLNNSPVPLIKTLKSHVLEPHHGQNLSSGPLQHYSKSDGKSESQQKIICDAMVNVNQETSSEGVQNTKDPKLCVTENSFEVWLAERGERWDKEHQRECVELGEFELLERAADEFSFSSNSSFICTLLRRDRRRLSSTPVKMQQQQPMLPGSHNNGVTGPSKELPTEVVNVAMRGCSEDKDKIDEADSDASLCSSTDFHTSGTPSQPFTHCFQVSAPPYDKLSYQDKEEAESLDDDEEENDGDSTVVDVRNRVEFDDDDTWNEPEEMTCISTDMNNQADRVLKRKVAVSKGAESDSCSVSPLSCEPDPPPTCQLVAKLFPALKPKPCPSPPVVQDPEDMHSEQGAAQSRLLRERLVELETEIERFRSENAMLNRLRLENEDVKENLRKERAEFQQKMADELAKWEDFKHEEGKKLQRDKKLFEKHAAAARARPDKQERDEIQSLKQQLNTLQEDLRKREARWTSMHHRLKQQLDSLSTENTTLRNQVRILEKLRLSAWKNAESEREKEKERGRSSIYSSSNITAQRIKSKSPSNSTQSCSSGKRESPEVQNPSKAPARSSSTRSTAWNAKPRNPQSQKEPCPVAASPISDEPVVPEERSHDSKEEGSPKVATEQSEMEEEITHTDGKIERILPDGGRLVVFPNGTKKELSSDGLSVKVTFFNGDIKHIMPDQRVIYYYAEAQTTHTTHPDGMEVLQFPNKQIEKHFPDGRKEITFPDQTVKNLYPDGREESVLADGTIIQQNPDGSKEIQFNTGQRELHTADFKKREYPDGTVKTVYSDGRQETRYPSGRVRLKDPQGRVIMATPS